MSEQLVEARGLPGHIGIIMDGNGRWAQLRGRSRPEGHRAGSEAVRRIVRASRRLGIGALTLYAFSAQNWERPDLEVAALMQLLHDFLVSERDEILEHGIRLRAVGNVDRLPPFVRDVLDPLAATSANAKGMVLSLALSYGGREEIAAVARSLAVEVRDGTLAPDAIDAELLRSRMPTLDVGDPDLIIRTGGDLRISNFLLYGSAYAELSFSPVLWPDFEARDLHAAIASFQHRERRFGRVLSVDGGV